MWRSGSRQDPGSWRTGPGVTGGGKLRKLRGYLETKWGTERTLRRLKVRIMMITVNRDAWVLVLGVCRRLGRWKSPSPAFIPGQRVKRRASLDLALSQRLSEGNQARQQSGQRHARRHGEICGGGLKSPALIMLYSFSDW